MMMTTMMMMMMMMMMMTMTPTITKLTSNYPPDTAGSSNGHRPSPQRLAWPADTQSTGTGRPPPPQTGTHDLASSPLTATPSVCRHHHYRRRDRLAGLVVKAPTSQAEDPGLESRWLREFFGSSHTSDFNIGTPVATLPGSWRYRVSAGTGRPGVSIL